MLVNYYYAIDTEMDEGDLLVLCGECRAKLGDKVEKAQRGDEECECEFCGASNDPAYSAQMDALYEQVNGRAPHRRAA